MTRNLYLRLSALVGTPVQALSWGGREVQGILWEVYEDNEAVGIRYECSACGRPHVETEFVPAEAVRVPRA